jgi:quinol monooxygenase YgiN
VSEPIVYVDNSRVREGKLEELKTAIKELAEFVDANEPRILAYYAFFNEDGTRMTVMHVHPDSASLEFHMEVGGPAFRRFTNLVEMSGIEVYGKPSDSLLERLRAKAAMLGSGTVVVHDFHAGFARFGGPSSG